jgi:hypothetical protein
VLELDELATSVLLAVRVVVSNVARVGKRSGR